MSFRRSFSSLTSLISRAIHAISLFWLIKWEMKLISFDRYLNNLWSSVDYLKNDIYDLQKLLHFECDLVPNAHHT